MTLLCPGVRARSDLARDFTAASSTGGVGRSPSESMKALTPVLQNSGAAAQLARFFPDVQAVELPVVLTRLRSGKANPRECVLVEFASVEKAIFRTSLPLEFADRVRLEREGEHVQSEATVVAVQYDDGRKAVAVKFAGGPCDWVKRP
jgi:hypothetical protein